MLTRQTCHSKLDYTRLVTPITLVNILDSILRIHSKIDMSIIS